MLLTALLAGVLLGLTACSGSQPPESESTVPPLASEVPPSGESEPAETAVTANIAACMEENPHSIGQSIAQTYEVSYQQVMTWFCSGYSFDNILIALETSAAVDVPAETLLEMLLEKDWEEIWAEVGFTNNP
jgi:hypothetical protein